MSRLSSFLRVLPLAAILLPVGVFTSAVWTGPAETNAALSIARKQYEACQYSQAISTLRAAIAASPNDAQLHYWLLRAVYEVGDFDAAIAAGERAVQLDPKNSDYYYWLGRSYGRKAGRESSLTNARKCKSAFEKAVQADPNNIAARRALMDYLAEAPSFLAGGSKSKAREQIAAITALDKVEGPLAQAAYWEADEKWQDAAAEYEKGFALKPKKASPYFEMASFYVNRKLALKAQEAVDAASVADPSDPELPFWRGAVLVVAGQNFPEAEKQLSAYLQTGCQRSGRPSFASAHVMLGTLYEKSGAREKAIEQYRKALQWNPKDKSASEGLKRLGQKN